MAKALANHVTWFIQPAGFAVPRFGERFVCTSDAYDRDLIALAKQKAEEQGIGAFIQEGVYCMVGGPTFESVTEGRLLRTLGADAMGEWQLVSAVI